MEVPKIPRFLQLADFFPADTGVRLLDYAIANESRFEPAKFGQGREADPSIRNSLRLPDIGPLQPVFEQRILEMAPEFLKRLGLAAFTPAAVETELVAHGDGAFYASHIDTADADPLRYRTRRLLSLVYYFHFKPKSFSGGALRIFAFGAADADSGFVDILPEDNTLVVFPSWILHEVRPVVCPSGRFQDSRFAVNVWLRQTNPRAVPTT
jgi:SM-20-related protein